VQPLPRRWFDFPRLLCVDDSTQPDLYSLLSGYRGDKMEITFARDSISGELLGMHAERPRTITRRRICKTEGCVTVLSIYNAKPRCAFHS
jgi:hypothetical protein